MKSFNLILFKIFIQQSAKLSLYQSVVLQAVFLAEPLCHVFRCLVFLNVYEVGFVVGECY